jgi:Zn finger protein HypA/HybF involved in hydrogenase expression
MTLPIPPNGFEKATGVIEGRKHCNHCGHEFPVTHEADSQCPACRSTATISKTPTAIPDRIQRPNSRLNKIED